MQPLNDDMDEIFRRAADDYPLNTNGSNWDKVEQELNAQNINLSEDKKRKDRRFLWLLLLLPIGIFIGRYLGIKNAATPGLTNTEVVKSGAKSVEIKPAVPTHETSIAPEDRLNEEASLTTVDEETGNGGVNNRKGSITYDALKPAIDTNKKHQRTTPFDKRVFRTSSSNNHATLGDLNENRSQTSDSEQESKEAKAEITSSSSNAKELQQVEENPLPANNTKASREKETSSSLTTKSTADTFGETIKTKKGRSSNPTSRQTRFSYSLLAGPDISTVKFDRSSKIGYSVGILLGYSFNDKMTVETGLLWDRKNYYSGGKYLDTSRLKLPAHSKVLEAQGYCQMIEIPINLRFSLITKNSHSWFVSGGLSSYLMIDEDYDLKYERYNQVYSKNYGYANSSKDWFSMMNISAGYQKVFRKNTNVSIAPYIKLPLQGVGIGRLPVSSTGLYISVSRYFK